MTQFTIAIFDFHIVALYSKSYPIKFMLYQQKITILVRYAHLTMRNGCQPVFRKKKKKPFRVIIQRVRLSGFEVSFAFTATCH